MLATVTETCTKMYIVEYIVVFGLKDILVNSRGFLLTLNLLAPTTVGARINP